MTRPSTHRPPRARRSVAGAAITCLRLGALLAVAACGELRVGQWAEGTPPAAEDGQPGVPRIRRAMDEDAAYPNLASVPPRPANAPTGTALQERLRALQGDQQTSGGMHATMGTRAAAAGAAKPPQPSGDVPEFVPPPAPDLGNLRPPSPPRTTPLPSTHELIPEAPVPAVPGQGGAGRDATGRRAQGAGGGPSEAPPARSTTSATTPATPPAAAAATAEPPLPPPAPAEPAVVPDPGGRAGPPTFRDAVPRERRLQAGEGIRTGLGDGPLPEPSPRTPGRPGALELAATLPPKGRAAGPQTGPRALGEFRAPRPDAVTERLATLRFAPDRTEPTPSDAAVLRRIAEAQDRLSGAIRIVAVAGGDTAQALQDARARARAVAAELIRQGAAPSLVYSGARAAPAEPAAPNGGAGTGRAAGTESAVEVYLDY
ncbi:MAG TPA: hypothetical protein VEY95_06785 [Azospirillaceae bacterium]|nr:hypothetical protein [Azospirillaceae bacterium]